jgi:hypothetical protein
MSRVYRGSGSAAYHPSMLLGLLIYGYATGVFSSRKIERATYDSVAFRFIASNEHPDHDTLAVFRKRFLREIEELFVTVLKLAGEMGVLTLGTVALDGTKVQANASGRRRFDVRPKPGGKPPSPPAVGLREDNQVNLTDAESRIMKMRRDSHRDDVGGRPVGHASRQRQAASGADARAVGLA